jgi:hypothetical protein
MADALAVLHSMFVPTPASYYLAEVIEKHPVFAALAVYAIYRVLWDNAGRLAGPIPQPLQQLIRPLMPARVVIYASIFVLAIGLAPATASPFIYFAF